MTSDIENIILLSIDALRADHLSHLGYPRNTSPILDHFASENVVFTNAFSPSSHTREAIPALLTGLFPDQAVDYRYHLDAPTVAKHLSEKSFSTAAFHSNPFISRAYDYDIDFDVFDDDLRAGNFKLIALFQRAIDKLRNRNYARAPTINNRSLEWINDAEDGFFLWNHYMDVHGPYEPSSQYQDFCRDAKISQDTARELYKKSMNNPDLITESEREALIDLYDAEIKYVDEYIGRFHSELQKRELIEKTLLIITSDHGDAFGEHGYYEHPRQLHEELLHVPLILIHPDLNPKRHTGIVSTLDIVPTILDVVDLSFDDYPGKSLLQVLESSTEFEDRLVFSEVSGEKEEKTLKRFAVRSTADKHILTRRISSAKVVDEFNEMGNNRDIIEQLYEYSHERLTDEEPKRPRDERKGREIEDRLEALGYLD